MIKYSIRYIKFRGEIDNLVFDFNEEYKLLANFLSSDVTPFEDWIKADFDKVISGESQYEEVNGNVCHVEIRPETTKVYNELVEDDEEYYSTCCEVNTKELRQLIDEWCEKYHEFKRKQSK